MRRVLKRKGQQAKCKNGREIGQALMVIASDRLY